MKFGLLLFLFFGLAACGGSLSKEEREELKKGSESQRIRKLAEADILEESMRRGREIVSMLSPAEVDNSIDSLSKLHRVEIHWVKPGSPGGLVLEQQIIDAYVMGGSQIDNVQPVGEDSVLYTSPVVDELPDGAIEVKGMWSLLFAKRDLILSMD